MPSLTASRTASRVHEPHHGRLAFGDASASNGAPPRTAPIEPSISQLKLTREGVARAFHLAPDTLAALEEAGVVRAGADGAFDVAIVAAALFNYGVARARAADEKLVAVASALNDALPALQRLSSLPDKAALEGEARDRVTLELSAFFNAFSGLLARATDALKGDPPPA